MNERALSLAGALVLPALALPLLAVPGVRAAVLDAGSGWVQADDLHQVAVQQPGTGRRATRGWGTIVSGGSPATVSSGTIGRQRTAPAERLPPRAAPLPPPPPPTAPWATAPAAAGRAEVVEPPVTLGPVQRLTRTVPAGQGVPLPAGTGLAHVLCSGPGAPGATYWLDDSSGTGTMVHRADGSGTYDLWFRWASSSYRQTEPCA